MKKIELELRIKLINVIVKAMDEETVNELDMSFSDTYAERMAEAAINVLLAMQELDHWFKEQGMLL